MFTQQRDALPAKQRIKEGRRLVLIDIENAAGTADPCPTRVRNVFAALPGTGGRRAVQDQVVLAASHHAMKVAAFEWPGSSHKAMRSGPDGADLALLEVLDAQVADRFTEVFLVSGDGIFTEAVERLVAQGVVVTVLSRPTGLAARLRAGATTVIYLPDTDLTTAYRTAA